MDGHGKFIDSYIYVQFVLELFSSDDKDCCCAGRERVSVCVCVCGPAAAAAAAAASQNPDGPRLNTH